MQKKKDAALSIAEGKLAAMQMSENADREGKIEEVDAS
jgi:hypothetical protein